MSDTPSTEQSPVSDTLLSLAALAGFAALGWMAHRGASIELLVAVIPISAIPALLYVRRRRGEISKAALFGIFVVGVLARLFFLGSDPLFSDDVYRYLWDGRVQAAGLSPYGVAPNHESLDAVEFDWPADTHIRAKVNHPDIPTIYPPLLELAYRAVAEVGGGLEHWRVLLILVDVGLALALLGLLRVRSLDRRWVALYLWHPLPIVENSWSAHAEVVAVALLVWAVYALSLGHRARGGLLLGLGGAAKLLPFGLLPFALKKYGWRSVVAALIAAGLCAVPFLDTDLQQATVGLSTYAETWYFNDVVFRPLGELLGLNPEDKKLASTQLWRRVLQGAWVASCLLAMWRGRDVVRVAGLIVLAFVLFTPTLHPWYVLWLLPFAILEGSVAGVVFSVTILFAYEVQIDWQSSGLWQESGWVRVFEILPALLVGLGVWYSRRGAASVGGSSGSASPP